MPWVTTAARRTAFSWLQHERLYQSVLSADEEGCLQLLQAICKETNRIEAARETFYNVLFVLRSAAGELELLMQQALHAEYDLSIPPQENLRRLLLYQFTLKLYGLNLPYIFCIIAYCPVRAELAREAHICPALSCKVKSAVCIV